MTPDQARRRAEEVELPRPAGYLCEWKSPLGLSNDQVFYHVEPGSATGDDWNREPDICKNAPYYTEHQVREAIAAALVKRTHGQERTLAKYQPCGCVICTCEDDERCHGCGAKHCGDHPIAEFTNPLYTRPIPSQQEERVRELEDALEVIRAIDAGGWKITRHQAWSSLTDEANALFAWSVERTEAPYCDGKGDRRWAGPTAVSALRAGKAAIAAARNKEQPK